MSNATQIPRQQITIANVEVHTRSRSQHPNQQTGHALAVGSSEALASGRV
jgi:hypothetical protein